MDTNLNTILNELQQRDRRSKRRALLFSFLPVAVALVLIYYTSSQVSRAQDNLRKLERQTDSVRKLRDRFQKEYLQAKGFDDARQNASLAESIKADNALRSLPLDSIHKNLLIRYYRKSLDQQKVWLAIRELGYENIVDLPSRERVLLDGETNAVVFDASVPVFDVKVIALTLMRAGFRLQHFDYSRATEQTIQIIRMAPADGSPNNRRSISVEELMRFTSTEEMVRATPF